MNSGGRHAKWNKPVTRRQVLYDPISSALRGVTFIGTESRRLSTHEIFILILNQNFDILIPPGREFSSPDLVLGKP